MTNLNADLRSLHNLRIQLQEITDELDRGPRLIAARQAGVEKKRLEVESQKGANQQAKVSADQKNLQINSTRAKIQDLQAKLNTAASNREYEILSGQIAADTMANGVLEDEYLELLEKIEVGQKRFEELEKEHRDVVGEFNRFKEDVEKRQPGLTSRFSELDVKVVAAEKFLPSSIVAQYQRLVKAHRSSALAIVEGKNCGCCYVSLTPQVLLEIQGGSLRFCSTCGRLLYMPEKQQSNT